MKHKTILIILFSTLLSVEAKSQVGPYFYVTNYGAFADGVHNDYQAIFDAIEAAHNWTLKPENKNQYAIVSFPTNQNTGEYTYLIDRFIDTNPQTPLKIQSGYPIGSFDRGQLRHYIFPLYSNIKFVGNGNSTIKLANELINYFSTNTGSLTVPQYQNFNLFYGVDQSNIEFEYLNFDFNGKNNLLEGKQNPFLPSMNSNTNGGIKTIYGIAMDGGSNLKVKNCKFLDNPGLNDIYLAVSTTYLPTDTLYGNGFNLENCTFTNGGKYVGDGTKINIQSYDFSFVYTEWSNSRIYSNRIEEEDLNIALSKSSQCGGIEIHGSNSDVYNNTIIGCKPAIYIASGNSNVGNNCNNINPILETFENVNVGGYGLFDGIHPKKNVITDCYEGIILAASSTKAIKNITIAYNDITTIFKEQGAGGSIMAAIKCAGGNARCENQYDCLLGNANSSSYEGLIISHNTITFNEVGSNSDISDELKNHKRTKIAGVLVNSVQFSFINYNTITGMNWCGIGLEGSKWGTKNSYITNNTIQGFTEFKKVLGDEPVVGYFVVCDYYRPNNDCNDYHQKTFENVQINYNILLSNQIVANASASCNTTSLTPCFKNIFFDLPTWYGYDIVSTSPHPVYSLKPDIFELNSNTVDGLNYEEPYCASSTCTPISITGQSYLCLGSMVQLQSNSSGGVWSSTNTSIASVTSSGLVTAGLSNGIVDINYKIPNSEGCFNIAKLTLNVSSAAPKPTIVTPYENLTSNRFLLTALPSSFITNPTIISYKWYDENDNLLFTSSITNQFTFQGDNCSHQIYCTVTYSDCNVESQKSDPIYIFGNYLCPLQNNPCNDPTIPCDYVNTRATPRTQEATQETTSIVLYPNPSKGNFNIKFPSTSKGTNTVKLLDLFGKTIIQQTVIGGTINININNTLASGIYIVQITNKVSGKIETQKLIIKN